MAPTLSRATLPVKRVMASRDPDQKAQGNPTANMVNAAPAIALSVRCAAGRRHKGRRCPSTSRTMLRCRERGLCAMIAAMRRSCILARNRSFPRARGRFCCCARIRATQGESERATCAGCARGEHHRYGRARPFPAYTTLRASEDVPSAHDPSGVHDLFPRGIPLIPLNPAESHLKLVFRSDREPAHVDGMHVGREETGVGVLCCGIALAGERSEAPESGIFAAIPNGVESTSLGCRKPGSAGLPAARYFAPATL